MADRSKKFAWVTAELVEEHAAKLKAPHVAALRADVGGVKYTTAAEKLGTKVGTHKSRLNRAREALRLLVVHPNGVPKFATDGTMLDTMGNRSIFDDVDE